MIRVLVLYPRIDGCHFDAEYYKNCHIPLVIEKLKPITVEIDFGISSPAYVSPYVAVTHMVFESFEQMMQKYQFAARELLEDKSVFTDIEIISQISQIFE